MTTNNPYGLTRANRANLLKLADYLESLPRGYRHFDMASFVGGMDDEDETLIDYMRHNGGLYDKCGTVGCALGHGPASGVYARLGVELQVKSRSRWTGIGYRMEQVHEVNWTEYSYRFVAKENPERGLLWDFLFSGNWAATSFAHNWETYSVKVDDHHYGAAARIRFILAGRLIPASFDDDDRLELVRAKRLYKEFRK